MKKQLIDFVNHGSLSQDALESIFDAIFAGDFQPEQLAAFLSILRQRGENGSELTAASLKMRKFARCIKISDSLRPLMDNCGTGGDGSESFNLSTASAIVMAYCGVQIAKHGNKAVSSRCGSADLIAEAGFPTDLDSNMCKRLLEKFGFTFFFAPQFHPALKAIMPVRRALGFRTIFNLLGPLANPISPEIQIIGVPNSQYMPAMAEALSNLGVHRGLIVHSQDGLDEISPSTKTDAIFIESRKQKRMLIDPHEFDMHSDLDSLKGGDAKENLKILRSLLNGSMVGPGPAVALNAGYGIWLAGKADSPKIGVEKSVKAILSGKVQQFFTDWIAYAQFLRKEQDNV